MLGKYYNVELNINKLIEIVKLIPNNERYSIKMYSFEYLWTNVWTWSDMSENTQQYNKKYEESRNKFNLFKENYLYMFDKYPTNINEPEWEFPKGRRIIGESNVQCAIRECLEETGIYPENIHESKVFHEKFIGTDGIDYCNNYYISHQTSDMSVYYNFNENKQNSEIRKIGWFSIYHSLKLINNYEYKKKMLMYLQLHAKVN